MAKFIIKELVGPEDQRQQDFPIFYKDRSKSFSYSAYLLDFLIYKLTYQFRQMQQNNQLVTDLQNILKKFYKVLIHNQSRKTQKYQILQSSLKSSAKDNNNTQSKIQKSKQPNPSQPTSEDAQNVEYSSTLFHIMTSKMTDTKYSLDFSSQNYLKCTNNHEVSQCPTFLSFSIHKVLIYSLFINFVRINRTFQHNHQQQNFMYSYRLAQMIVKSLKKAMMKATKMLKQVNRKRYAKNCFLYKQLINYTKAQNIDSKQDYLRIIIEQFDSDHLQNVFHNLQEKKSELACTRSTCLDYSFDLSFAKSMKIEEINHQLACLDVQAILYKENQKKNLKLNHGCIGIVVEELSDHMFQLKKIVICLRKQINK